MKRERGAEAGRDREAGPFCGSVPSATALFSSGGGPVATAQFEAPSPVPPRLARGAASALGTPATVRGLGPPPPPRQGGRETRRPTRSDPSRPVPSGAAVGERPLPPHLGDGARAHVASLAPQAPAVPDEPPPPPEPALAHPGNTAPAPCLSVKRSSTTRSLRRSSPPPSPARWDSRLPLRTSSAQTGGSIGSPTPVLRMVLPLPPRGRAERKRGGGGGEGADVTFRLAAQPWQPVPFGGASLPRYSAPSHSLRGGGARHNRDVPFAPSPRHSPPPPPPPAGILQWARPVATGLGAGFPAPPLSGGRTGARSSVSRCPPPRARGRPVREGCPSPAGPWREV